DDLATVRGRAAADADESALAQELDAAARTAGLSREGYGLALAASTLDPGNTAAGLYLHCVRTAVVRGAVSTCS
ncbi:MAG: hypothetical protein OJJ54_09650, partial [Pseudonocardia sp.]|nr:hypothetical protein [Pseudonocardia sp.]